MKKATVLFMVSALLSVGLFTNFTLTAGPVTTKDYNITGFTSVQAGSTFDVELVPSNSYNVTVTANEKLFDKIRAFFI